MTDDSSPADQPGSDAPHRNAERDGDTDVAPGVARLEAPGGVAADPPPPMVVAQLPDAAGGGPSYVEPRKPSLTFLTAVAVLSFVADIASKTWAEKHLEGFPGNIPIWKDHIAFVLAKNKGGAWGLLQSANESVRRPFFLLVSVAAIAFIMTLYRKLNPRQYALKWGLPLVLGGALGNVFDRIRYGSVIDFIDCHLSWGGRDHHWPTFNVADVAICVGVGLMAIDMFTAQRGGTAPRRSLVPTFVPEVPAPPAAEPSAPPTELASPVEPAATHKS
jgi:lipoprotein signal peptidase